MTGYKPNIVNIFRANPVKMDEGTKACVRRRLYEVDKENFQPLSQEEKMELYRGILALSGSEDMEEVASILQASDEVEVDLDALDTLTLIQLKAYVASCQAKSYQDT